MYKRVVPFLLAAALISCNDTPKEEKTAEMDHSTMDHTTAAPELPAVPDNAKVFFANFKDGDVVKSPLVIQMGVENMSVDTANGNVKAGSGHHHIIIDGPDYIDAGTSVPKDSTHLHFGNAQTEATVPLSFGKHTLTLQFADALHRSYGQKLATKITVDVK